MLVVTIQPICLYQACVSHIIFVIGIKINSNLNVQSLAGWCDITTTMSFGGTRVHRSPWTVKQAP